MEIDNEMIEIFIDEIGELEIELAPTVNSLQSNAQQAELFLTFAQVIDRIYGTAITMGFKDIGEYLGAVRNITRKCGNANIPRAMTPVFRIVKSCLENFGGLKKSLRAPEELKILKTKMSMEIKKIDKIDAEIFAFSKDAKTNLK